MLVMSVLIQLRPSPYVQGAPVRGRTDAIGPWLEANGIPRSMYSSCLVWSTASCLILLSRRMLLYLRVGVREGLI